MPDVDDIALLREYAESHSESAFAEIVRRRVNLVYSVALRFTNNSEDAQDVTQAVFVILATKAGRLRPKTILTGWLYETTRFTAMNFLTRKTRRESREQEAFMQSTLNESEVENIWPQLAPLLEEAMTRLSEKERTLVALRFFDNKTIVETAALMGINEWTARKRVERSMEKLRNYFSKCGVTSTTATIAGTISANSIQAAPVALIKTTTAIALAKGATASVSTLTLIKGALKIMAWSKMKMAIVAGAVVLLAVGTTTVTIHQIKKGVSNSWQSLDHFRGQAEMLKTLNETPQQVTILPTIHPDWGATWWSDRSGRLLGMNSSVTNLLMDAYGERPSRMVFSKPTEGGRYDFIANLPQGSEAAFQQKIKEQFGVVAHQAVVSADVWLLKVSDSEKIKTIINTSGHASRETGGGKWKMENATFSNLANALEGLCLFAPVIDRTELVGKYDFALNWDKQDKSKRVSMVTDELKQVGIELVPTNMPLEMLVVEKAN